MRSTVLILAASAQIATPGIAQSSTAAGIVMLRPRTIAPKDDVIRYVADNAAASTFSQRDWPTLKRLSARSALETLCGSAPPALVERYLIFNSSRTGLPRDPDAPLGDAGYGARFPACLFVTSQATTSLPVKIRSGDNKWNLSKSLLGKPPNLSEVQRVFSAHDLPDRDLPVGLELRLPYTLQVGVRPTGVTEDAFIREVVSRSGGTVDATTPTIGGALVDPDDPVTASCVSVSPESPDYPLDAVAIDKAFDFQTRLRTRASVLNAVRVAVVDNGFFGVPKNEPPQWGARFPETFFETSRYPRGRIGPMMAGQFSFHPINYFNEPPASVVDRRTGHGTHVAGIITGGAEFTKLTSVFSSHWLKLSVVNLTGGGDSFYDGVDQVAFTLLGQTKHIDIVNMSVGAPKERSAHIIALPTRSPWTESLFVAAAGSGYDPAKPSPALYPARLGGRYDMTSNVVTVGSVDADRAVSAFSQRGSFVDLVAPGCRIKAPLSLDTEDRLSGTSQAAALVTGAAAMLRAVWDAEPADLKRRLVVSGRLLPAATDRQAVVGRVELDTLTALMVRHDVLRVRSGDRIITLLGRLMRVDGLKCVNSSPPDWDDLRAFKTAGQHAELFIFSATDGSFDKCEAATGDANATVSFKAEFELVRGDPVSPPRSDWLSYPAADVVEFVRREREFEGGPS